MTDYISEINNIQVDNVEETDVVMPMYILIEYSDNYSKHMEVYGSIIEMSKLSIKLVLLFILLIMVIVNRLILKKK